MSDSLEKTVGFTPSFLLILKVNAYKNIYFKNKFKCYDYASAESIKFLHNFLSDWSQRSSRELDLLQKLSNNEELVIITSFNNTSTLFTDRIINFSKMLKTLFVKDEFTPNKEKQELLCNLLNHSKQYRYVRYCHRRLVDFYVSADSYYTFFKGGFSIEQNRSFTLNLLDYFDILDNVINKLQKTILI